MNTLTPIGITMGDPAGIGPEIVVKLLSARQSWPCVVYGDARWLERTARRLNIDCQVRPITEVSQMSAKPSDSVASDISGGSPVLWVIDTFHVPETLPLGQVSAKAGQSAYASVSRAIDDALAGEIRAIVTAPLNKQAIGMAGIEFPGHTEILAARSGDIPVAMMLANQVLRVILVTIHEPLRQVPDLLSIDAELQTISLAHQACRQLGIDRPRIAVAGLNPHAGEAGKFGREEIDIIAPAIEQAQKMGMDVSGPWPGDTVFARARQGEFDIVVAQYHDQGLIPVKYMGLDEGVNVTVGLPFVRTSVDHGTAFDIADQGIASAESLHCALVMAEQLSRA